MLEVEALAGEVQGPKFTTAQEERGTRRREGGRHGTEGAAPVHPAFREAYARGGYVNGQPMDNDRDAAFSSFNQRGSGVAGGYRQDDAAYGSFRITVEGAAGRNTRATA